jgi:hypothetical protein
LHGNTNNGIDLGIPPGNPGWSLFYYLDFALTVAAGVVDVVYTKTMATTTTVETSSSLNPRFTSEPSDYELGLSFDHDVDLDLERIQHRHIYTTTRFPTWTYYFDSNIKSMLNMDARCTLTPDDHDDG